MRLLARLNRAWRRLLARRRPMSLDQLSKTEQTVIELFREIDHQSKKDVLRFLEAYAWQNFNQRSEVK